MRLTRKNDLRRPPVQPVATVNNYTLARFTVGKSGLIFGNNRFGSKWIEIHLGGITLLTYFYINNNPYITAETPRNGRRPA